MLNRFSCIALAGVATEYLLYGYAEGGLGDISKVPFSSPFETLVKSENMMEKITLQSHIYMWWL